MHHIYHTEGIILGSRNFKEANKYFYILTRDLGLVYAEAEGIRKISSKLRFVLQDFSYVKVDLVKRKNLWRITSAIKTNELDFLKKDFLKLKIFGNINRLLIRLLPEQENNEKLFTDFLEGLKTFEKTDNKNDFKNIEIILVLKILHNLGYLNGEGIFSDNIASPIANEFLLDVSKNKTLILRQINKALRESHL